jgi:FlgD Ig-like domain
MQVRKRAFAPVLCLTSLILTIPTTHLRAETQLNTISRWLKWTTTGDDGLQGRASKYDIRYSGRPISGTDTLSWWNSAAIVYTVGKSPPSSGTPDSVLVAGLAIGTTYYALMRIGDEVTNWSGYSNLAVIGTVTAVEGDPAPPPARALAAPNPFGSSTVFRFTLPAAQETDVAAYDASGRLVRRLHHGVLEAGEHRLGWDGRDESGRPVASGIYFLRVRSASVKESTKVFRLR